MLLGFESKAGKINLTLHPKGKTEGVHSLHFFLPPRLPNSIRSGQNKYKLELPVLMIRVLIKKMVRMKIIIRAANQPVDVLLIGPIPNCPQ
jgi:hypothetical protein